MGIPGESFGDAVTLTEFLNSFSFLFDVEEELGGAITIGKLITKGHKLYHPTIISERSQFRLSLIGNSHG